MAALAHPYPTSTEREGAHHPGGHDPAFAAPGLTGYTCWHVARLCWRVVPVPMPRLFPSDESGGTTKPSAPTHDMVMPIVKAEAECLAEELRRAQVATCMALAARVPQCVDHRFYERIDQLMQCEHVEQMHAAARIAQHGPLNDPSPKAPRAMALWLLIECNCGHGQGVLGRDYAVWLLNSFCQLASARTMAPAEDDQSDTRLAARMRFAVACREDAKALLPTDPPERMRLCALAGPAALLITWVPPARIGRAAPAHNRSAQASVLLPIPVDRISGLAGDGVRLSASTSTAPGQLAQSTAGLLEAPRQRDFPTLAHLLHDAVTAAVAPGDAVACDRATELALEDAIRTLADHAAGDDDDEEEQEGEVEEGAVADARNAPPARRLVHLVPLPSAWWRVRLSPRRSSPTQPLATWQLQHAVATRALLRSLHLPTALLRQRSAPPSTAACAKPLFEYAKLANTNIVLRMWPWQTVEPERNGLLQYQQELKNSFEAQGQVCGRDFDMDATLLDASRLYFNQCCAPAFLMCNPDKRAHVLEHLKTHGTPYLRYTSDLTLQAYGLHLAYAAYTRATPTVAHKVFAAPAASKAGRGSSMGSACDLLHVQYKLEPLTNRKMGYRPSFLHNGMLHEGHFECPIPADRVCLQQLPWANFVSADPKLQNAQRTAISTLRAFADAIDEHLHFSPSSLLVQDTQPTHHRFHMPPVLIDPVCHDLAEDEHEARQMEAALRSPAIGGWREIRAAMAKCMPEARGDEDGDGDDGARTREEDMRARARGVYTLAASATTGQLLVQAALLGALEPDSPMNDPVVAHFVRALTTSFGATTTVRDALRRATHILEDHQRHDMSADEVLALRALKRAHDGSRRSL